MPDRSYLDASASIWPAPLRAAGRMLLDLLYPPRCAGCGRVGVLFCRACQANIVPIPATRCPRCGSAAGEAGGLCHACRHAPVPLNGILSTGMFAPPLRQAIYNFKYHHVCGLAEPFAERMAAVWIAAGLEADLTVPVPLHPSRETERGYNQAALLAQAIAPRLGLPMAGDLLARQRMTPSQVSLNWRERRANVSGAFTCDGDTLGLRVVLVDDVCTTGATLEECAAALRACGAISVWGLTVARAALPARDPGAVARQSNRVDPQSETGEMQKR